MFFACVRAPPHFAARGHVKCTWIITRMVFNYTEVLVYRSFTHLKLLYKTPLVKGTVHGNKEPFGTKIKVKTCNN